MSTITALTVSQPYASMIASGEKWVENRTWPTRYRGRLVIHAGRGTQYLTRGQLEKYPSGVLCSVQLVACVELVRGKVPGEQGLTADAVAQLEAAGVDVAAFCQHEHTEGPFCWVLQNVRRFREPLPARGMPGLWEWEVPDHA